MKVYIHIDTMSITFDITPQLNGNGCRSCGCHHNIYYRELEVMNIKFDSGGKCERTKYYYKTFAKRLRLKIRSNV